MPPEMKWSHVSAYCLACRGVYDVTRWPGSG